MAETPDCEILVWADCGKACLDPYGRALSPTDGCGAIDVSMDPDGGAADAGMEQIDDSAVAVDPDGGVYHTRELMLRWTQKLAHATLKAERTKNAKLKSQRDTLLKQTKHWHQKCFQLQKDKRGAEAEAEHWKTTCMKWSKPTQPDHPPPAALQRSRSKSKAQDRSDLPRHKVKFPKFSTLSKRLKTMPIGMSLC